jgi:hypothetical protein
VEDDRPRSLSRLDLGVLPGELAVARLDPAGALPDWAAPDGELHAVIHAPGELTVVCPAARVPNGVRAECGWRALRVAGPLDFALTGVLASLAGPLADAGVSVFAIATFDTDYLLVRSAGLADAVAALRAAGHRVGDG